MISEKSKMSVNVSNLCGNMIPSKISKGYRFGGALLYWEKTMDGPEYALSDKATEWGAEVLEKKRPDLLDLGIAVGFVVSFKKKTKGKTKKVLGECKKTQDLYRLFCPYDFLIVIYDQNCVGLTDDQMHTLIWHELLHIGIDEKGKPYVKPHDVEEFDEIINECGLRWNK